MTYEVRCRKCRHPFEVFATVAGRESAIRAARCPQCGTKSAVQELRTPPMATSFEETRLSKSLAALKPEDRLPGEHYRADKNGLNCLVIRNERHLRDVRKKWHEHKGEKLVEV